MKSNLKLVEHATVQEIVLQPVHGAMVLGRTKPGSNAPSVGVRVGNLATHAMERGW